MVVSFILKNYQIKNDVYFYIICIGDQIISVFSTDNFPVGKWNHHINTILTLITIMSRWSV